MGRILAGYASACLLALVLTACMPNPKADEAKQEKEEKARSSFLVCNKWIDTDQDAVMLEDELVGCDKDTFRAQETIMFVGFFRNQKKDTRVSIVILNPAEDIVKHSEYVLPEDKTSVYRLGPFQVRDVLTSKAETPSGPKVNGPGVYTIQWYIEKVLVSEQKISLIE